MSDDTRELINEIIKAMDTCIEALRAVVNEVSENREAFVSSDTHAEKVSDHLCDKPECDCFRIHTNNPTAHRTLDERGYTEVTNISPPEGIYPRRDCGHESPGTELSIPGRYLCALPKEHVGVHQYAQMCWTDSGKTWSESPEESIARFDSEWARADAMEGRR